MGKKEFETIKKLIEDGREGDLVDFKLKFYTNDKKYDFIKDVLSLANGNPCADKYLIIGYDNKSKTYQDIDYDTIEDISNYNQLISEYCDPYIDITLDRIEANSHKLMFVRVKESNCNTPYLVKKEYKKAGRIFLRKGEIYVRKNANNFIASRDDLDEIYENKKRIIVENDGTEIGSVSIRSYAEYVPKFCVMVKLTNNTTSNIAINDGKIKFKYETNCFEANLEYIEEYSKTYKKELITVNKNPFQLNKETQSLRSLIFELSEDVYKIMQNRLFTNEKPMVTVTLIDLQGKEYRLNFALSAICGDD